MITPTNMTTTRIETETPTAIPTDDESEICRGAKYTSWGEGGEVE